MKNSTVALALSGVLVLLPLALLGQASASSGIDEDANESELLDMRGGQQGSKNRALCGILLNCRAYLDFSGLLCVFCENGTQMSKRCRKTDKITDTCNPNGVIVCGLRTSCPKTLVLDPATGTYEPIDACDQSAINCTTNGDCRDKDCI